MRPTKLGTKVASRCLHGTFKTMSTSGNEHSYSDALKTLRAVFASLKSESVQVGGDNGHFVKRSLMKDAEAKVKEMFEEFEGDVPAELEDMATEIANLKESVSRAQKLITSKENDIKLLSAAVKEFEDKAAAHKLGEQNAVEVMKAEKANAGTVIEELNRELGKVKANIAAKSRGGNADEVKPLVDTQVAMKKQLSEAQEERKRLTKAIEKANAERDAELAKKDETNRVLKKTREELSLLKSQRARAEKAAPLTETAFEINVPLVQMLLGKTGLERLRRIDLQYRINLQKYAYGLLETVNSERSTRSIGDLLKLAIEWIKQKGFAAREALRPWLEMIHRDLASAKLQTMRAYRLALQDIVGEFKKAKKTADEEKPQWNNRTRWWYSSVVFFRNQRKRLSIGARVWLAVRRTATATKKVVVGLYSGLTNLFKFRHEKEVSASDFGDDDDDEKSVVSETTAPEVVGI